MLGRSAASALRFGSSVMLLALVIGTASALRLGSDPLRDPCGGAMHTRAPDAFAMTFATNLYGSFTATCVRDRAPVWVDRVYNLARLGYYSDNYFLRVLNTSHLKIIQFGTGGVPATSNIYNWSSTPKPKCAILTPQPPDMPRCMANASLSKGCPTSSGATLGLSNTYGTIAMSTSSNASLADYPHGVTYNATAELFINTGNNSWLDPMLFVPICTIDAIGMENSVLSFPSFGELADLGGPGPSLGLLYERGNAYIRANQSWASMAQATRVQVHVPPLAMQAHREL